MIRIVALYGSPRRNGNTSTLMRRAVDGAREAGASVDEIQLRDLKISPCLEIYGCKTSGRCIIKDEFHEVLDKVTACDAIMLSSPIFFYTVSSHTKIFMDRCQSQWVRRYWLEKIQKPAGPMGKKGLFISVGATRGKKLFDGALLTVRYFLNALDTGLWKSLLYRGLDAESDAMQHPEYLDEAYAAGRELVELVSGTIDSSGMLEGGSSGGSKRSGS